MAIRKKDPTDPIRIKASRYPGVDEGTACTQSSFKAGKGSFLFIGMQGGRYKAMFKLQKSAPEAARLAGKDSECYEVGKSGWVVARFTAEKPIPKRLWEKWLDESYRISLASGSGKKPAGKKTAKKKAARKKVARRKAMRKAVPSRRSK